MKTKFNYNSIEKDFLLNLALKGLEKKIDTLPNISSLYEEKVDEKFKLEKYEGYIRNEIKILETMKFDGYLLLIYDLLETGLNMAMQISLFGSIQNSLTAYVLGVLDSYSIKSKKDFINFTPFEINPTINIVATSSRYHELIDFVNNEYASLVSNTSSNSIKFNDNLEIKFHDLDVGQELRLEKDDVLNLGLNIIEPNINVSAAQTVITNNNELALGLNALKIGDVAVNCIIEGRDYFYDTRTAFKSIEDLKARVPLLETTDKETQNIIVRCLENDLVKMETKKLELRKQQEKNIQIDENNINILQQLQKIKST